MEYDKYEGYRIRLKDAIQDLEKYQILQTLQQKRRYVAWKLI